MNNSLQSCIGNIWYDAHAANSELKLSGTSYEIYVMNSESPYDIRNVRDQKFGKKLDVFFSSFLFDSSARSFTGYGWDCIFIYLFFVKSTDGALVHVPIAPFIVHV